ncbi:PE-PPE domain-containing protein [[Mycobacterium] appelbergii]|uniref:PE-PPE domain-containing protein n=1 Tax=[Mycobacterium] appelbergii TaxID=2939269 RepID=UPI0039778803
MNKLFVAAVAAGMVGSVTAFGSGVASAETAFIVPGTAPSPYPALRALYHFDPATRTAIGANYYDSAAATREVVPYPGSLWPITGENSLTLGQSVDQGTNNLDARIRSTDGNVTASGLSQGVLALNAEQARLANDPTAPPPDELTFVKAGNPDHLFTKWFRPGTTVPVLGYTVPAQVDSQYDTVDVVAQYDIFSDPLDRPGNLLALANAIVAGGSGHTATAFSDPAGIAPQNVTVSTNSRGATTTTYFIPAEQLPLVEYLSEGGMSPEMAGALNRYLTPMVNRAYGPPPPPVQPGLRLPDINGFNAIPISAPLNAVSTAANAVNIAGQVRRLLPKKGIQLPKNGIPLLPKGKKKR